MSRQVQPIAAELRNTWTAYRQAMGRASSLQHCQFHLDQRLLAVAGVVQLLPISLVLPLSQLASDF